jgi:hypothetical protein
MALLPGPPFINRIETSLRQAWHAMSLPALRPASLTPVFHDWSLAFEQTIPRDALTYWNECRGTRAMPRMTEISARGMKKFLTHVSLLDIETNSDGSVDYIVKLTGERVREHYGSVAHRRLSEFLPEEMEQRWRAALDLVRSERRPLRVHGRMSYGGHVWLYQETLLAPLGGDGDDVEGFLLITAWTPSRMYG